MKDNIARRPSAVYFFGESTKHDVDLLTLAIERFWVIGLKDDIHQLRELLPKEMLAIEHDLAKNILTKNGLKHLYFFENLKKKKATPSKFVGLLQV